MCVFFKVCSYQKMELRQTLQGLESVRISIISIVVIYLIADSLLSDSELFPELSCTLAGSHNHGSLDRSKHSSVSHFYFVRKTYASASGKHVHV